MHKQPTYRTEEYTYAGLCGVGSQPAGASLAYLVGLVGSTENPISDLKTAKRALAWLFDVEEQLSVRDLLRAQRQALPDGYSPLTPVLLTKRWSPIGALLEHEIAPMVLNRESRPRALASGIWDPHRVTINPTNDDRSTCERFFWSVISEASSRGRKRRKLLSIVAQPGWSYETKIGSLKIWTPEEVELSERIVWQRTPEG